MNSKKPKLTDKQKLEGAKEFLRNFFAERGRQTRPVRIREVFFIAKVQRIKVQRDLVWKASRELGITVSCIKIAGDLVPMWLWPGCRVTAETLGVPDYGK